MHSVISKQTLRNKSNIICLIPLQFHNARIGQLVSWSNGHSLKWSFACCLHAFHFTGQLVEDFHLNLSLQMRRWSFHVL